MRRQDVAASFDYHGEISSYKATAKVPADSISALTLLDSKRALGRKGVSLSSPPEYVPLAQFLGCVSLGLVKHELKL